MLGEVRRVWKDQHVYVEWIHGSLLWAVVCQDDTVSTGATEAEALAAAYAARPVTT